MKKTLILSLAILFCLSLLNTTPCYSFELFKKTNKTEKEIRDFLNDYNKVLEKNDLVTLTRFYDKEYKNDDGYNLEELIVMLDKTSKAFDDIKYDTKIKRIDIRKNCAVVHLEDNTSAKIYPLKKHKNRSKVGILDGKSTSVMYLRKKDGLWQIVYDSVLSEETSLKYGVAKKVDMDLNTPETIENGKDYGVKLEMKTPNRMIAIASLTNEEVNYPPEKYEEKFRRIPSEGILERLVKANDKNKDEYAIASIGFTKVSLNKKERRARIEILGMAYLMKRVNMNNIEPVNEILEKK